MTPKKRKMKEVKAWVVLDHAGRPLKGIQGRWVVFDHKTTALKYARGYLHAIHGRSDVTAMRFVLKGVSP